MHECQALSSGKLSLACTSFSPIFSQFLPSTRIQLKYLCHPPHHLKMLWLIILSKDKYDKDKFVSSEHSLCHNNTHLLEAMRHAHCPAPKHDATSCGLADDVLQLCIYQNCQGRFHPGTSRESRLHYFGPLHTPAPLSVSRGETLSQISLLSRTPKPDASIFPTAPSLLQLYKVQLPAHSSS